MRDLRLAIAMSALAVFGCGGNGPGGKSVCENAVPPVPAACDTKGMPPTSISGTVFAPNGTLPLFGINVYIPNTPVAAPPDGAICDRCGDTLPGFPVAHIQTDEAGRFVLTDVPSGANIPLIL